MAPNALRTRYLPTRNIASATPAPQFCGAEDSGAEDSAVQDRSAGQLVLDGLTGFLLGILIGLASGLASGIFVALIMFVIPFLAVIGIAALVYNVVIGVVSGAISGVVCGLVSGYRTGGLVVPFLGALTGGIPGVFTMLRWKAYGWEGARDEPFILYGLVIGAFCGLIVAAVIGVLNRPKTPAVR